MLFRRMLGMFACAALAAGLSATLQAQRPQVVAVQAPVQEVTTDAFVDETPELWFVELASAPASEGTGQKRLNAEKAAFRSAASKAGLRFKERYAFSSLFHGLSIRIKRSDLALLGRIPGVKAIYPVETIAIPPVVPSTGAAPDLTTALAMTGADIAQSELGYTGRGIKVAVVDTGIDYDHPDLGGDGVQRSNSTRFPTERVVAGYDFVGDAFDAGAAAPVIAPDRYPDDCAGHGSHVSGIIGANGVLTGVAPEVKFGAYRVFGCSGTTTADIMIAAMERALADGMQVLNMSIGSAYQWPEYPTAKAATRLVNKGVVVVASIGNNGSNGLWAAGAPGVGKKVIGVASFDNTHATLPSFVASSLGLGDYPVGYMAATGAPAPPTSGVYPLGRTGTPASATDACSALPEGSLAGQVALIKRGTCSFYIKATNAAAAGAVGVILYNNAAGFLSATVAPPEGSPAVTIPVVGITLAEGLEVNNRVAEGNATIAWTSDTVRVAASTANTISSFSSYGLSPDLETKPDVGAPGGYIYSTYPLELNGYASLSGTSMASPHTAGAVALYLQAHPHTPSQALGRILQNSAEPKPWSGNPGLGYLELVSRQGAGLLRIDKAILATTKIGPGKLSLGESEAGPVTRTLTVENDGPSDVTYDLSYVNALSAAKTFAPAFYTSNASVAFGVPSVTVPAGGSALVEVTITPPTGPDKAQYGGYLVFTPVGGGPVYRVPFAGFVGDYQSIQVLAPTSYNFPWLAYLSGSSYYGVATSHTYTMAGADIPYFLIHLDHQSALMRMEVFDAVTGKAWHRAYQEAFLPRNSGSSGFYAFPWSGYTTAGQKVYKVPNGSYVVKVSVLKALGDASNPAHWETWTSPTIVIAR